MHFVELKICEKVGKILIEASREHKGNDYELAKAWMYSDVFAEMIQGNEEYVSQARTFVSRKFLNEAELTTKDNAGESYIEENALYWFGYLITYWCLDEEIMPTEIVKRYSVDSILNKYDALHTVSIRMAIDKIQERKQWKI